MSVRVLRPIAALVKLPPIGTTLQCELLKAAGGSLDVIISALREEKVAKEREVTEEKARVAASKMAERAALIQLLWGGAEVTDDLLAASKVRAQSALDANALLGVQQSPFTMYSVCFCSVHGSGFCCSVFSVQCARCCFATIYLGDTRVRSTWMLSGLLRCLGPCWTGGGSAIHERSR